MLWVTSMHAPIVFRYPSSMFVCNTCYFIGRDNRLDHCISNNTIIIVPTTDEHIWLLLLAIIGWLVPGTSSIAVTVAVAVDVMC